ncbi:glycoprotein 3-alpha-L-fucosyltransferase A [Manduca sexta]|uniref:glycoprotein 3-alpha-L-fucosyltransferase A n=1 Tax=Manduca sexta TaxID=7130 RepID=UPI0018901632|nr:glycoprotein 3-alpha-L-fucosyltransferase A [Manduca sexta]XP_030030201.2 glycoprotein 3-alpha-L-fucosyltransferase A [Manduca sexta]
MWVRAARALRALRRAVLLLPLVLTALALLLLPRPPPLEPAARAPSSAPHPPLPPARPEQHLQNFITETDEETLNREGDEVSRRPWYMRGGEQRPWFHDANAKVFPEDAPGDDRIVHQLMYTLPKNEDVPLKKILLANGLGAWGVSGGRTEFIRNKCPVDRCLLTADSRDAATADAILFKDHHTPFNVKRPINQIWILYYLECPYHTASLRPSSLDVFNWTSTYRRDSDIVAPYERWVYHDSLITERDLDRNYAANKTKKVAWFVSNCHARNRRLQYARQLSKYIQVDIYGACGSHHCPRTDPNCLEMLDKEYKFYLAFENSNCRDYVTEKFFVNGLQHNVLPIVMGARASEYAAVAPHNSYVHVEEFAGAEELAAYLHRLDEDDDLYNSYFKWKGTGEFINTYFFCRVCAMVHANERRQRNAHYSDVQAWWREAACTRGEWRAMTSDAKDNG